MWFAKGENFAKQITGQFPVNKAEWAEYGDLLKVESKKTRTKNDEDAAVGLDPKNGDAY